MKPQTIMNTAILLSFLSLWVYAADCGANMAAHQNNTEQNTIAGNLGNYLGSDYKGNYAWGGAMNLAWNELNENILYQELKLDTKDAKALEMVEKLNNAPFSKKDLDPKSYYIKSGYGQQTVEQINRETKEKFPSKSFSDLNITLAPEDIISYAYFLKQVEYEIMFEKKQVDFNGQNVSGFFAGNETQKKKVKILKYDSDDKFIVKLALKDNSDELILAKGYDMANPGIVVQAINKTNNPGLESLGQIDYFSAPVIHLDHHRDYVELINKRLKNKNFDKYFIAKMFENIKFDMDEKGARVENEAAIVAMLSAAIEPREPRNFNLDKPYWIVMKRADSQYPYFILGVNNTLLMKKKN